MIVSQSLQAAEVLKGNQKHHGHQIIPLNPLIINFFTGLELCIQQIRVPASPISGQWRSRGQKKLNTPMAIVKVQLGSAQVTGVGVIRTKTLFPYIAARYIIALRWPVKNPRRINKAREPY